MRSDLGWNGMGGFSNDGSGIAKLASGSIVSPVSYIDIAFPVGYSGFTLRFDDIVFDASDVLAFAVSIDGGVTFFNDIVNADTYGAVIVYVIDSGDSGATITASGSRANDSLCYIQNSAVFPGTVDGIVLITPGNLVNTFRIVADTIVVGTNIATTTQEVAKIGSFLNPAAISPPSYARINCIRLQPYGNGDANPPTSTHKITGGHYALYGVEAN